MNGTQYIGADCIRKKKLYWFKLISDNGNANLILLRKTQKWQRQKFLYNFLMFFSSCFFFSSMKIHLKKKSFSSHNELARSMKKSLSKIIIQLKRFSREDLFSFTRFFIGKSFTRKFRSGSYSHFCISTKLHNFSCNVDSTQ